MIRSNPQSPRPKTAPRRRGSEATAAAKDSNGNASPALKPPTQSKSLTAAKRAPSKGPATKPIDNAPAIDFSAAAFRAKLNKWYRANARQLPWRGVKDPYSIWLSEIMLQQTRVATVIERYGQFLQRFPTLRSLAEADEADVLALWSGLGYYRRARMLHRGAQFVLREFRGKLPRTLVALRTLPGVGDYTAAAIASIAFGQSVAVLDGNVERVLLRLLGRAEDKSSRARAPMLAVAQQLMSQVKQTATRNPPGDHNQAMMELGATVCLPRSPLCPQCPVAEFCLTRGEHATAVRERQHSRIVAYLLAVRKRGITTEVLLERRDKTAGQMPGMLELPPLPLASIAGREPVLRLRHAITNTNFYVQVYAERAPGVQPEPRDDRDSEEIAESADLRAEADDSGDDDLFVADASELSHDPTLLDELSSTTEREWVAASRLQHLPLTGLARKTLQRLGVMALPRVQIG